MTPLIAGPLLGLEGEALYSICFVSPASTQQAKVVIEGSVIAAVKVASTPLGLFWRAEWSANQPLWGTKVSYQVLLDGAASTNSVLGSDAWSFYVPSEHEKPRMTYVSCNGFSDLKLMNTTKEPYALWNKLWQQHDEQAFSVMLMGGDQVYADSIWSARSLKQLETWKERDFKDKVKEKPTQATLAQLDLFYCELYCKNWQKNEHMANALACIPSVMMWDDHDIFDGWGSYPEELQQCEMYKAIYTAAAKYFELFQLRGFKHNKAKLNAEQTHYGLGLSLRGYSILALDHRSERTLNQVMSSAQWKDMNAFLDATKTGHLLVMSGVPVVYRDFSFVEKAMDATPWEEELTDDLKDHWRAKEHQGERARFIMRLLDNAKQRVSFKTVILSGDVHVGCLGVVKDDACSPPVKVHQLVSSGIMHPAPTAIEWAGICAVTNDRPETLDENGHIQINMLTAFGAGKYFRTRNFLTLQEGTDNKLWANWVCENNEKPVYPLG